MAFTVVQGTLPDNHTSVDPSSFLETWISQTQVFGLPAGAFKGGSLQFVVSSTDPPPIEERTPGMLWFKRGDGHLYVWDQNDLPSSASNAASAVVNWLSISDRRDLWARPVESMAAGSLFYWTVGATNVMHFKSATGASLAWDPFFSRIMWDLSVMGGAPTAPTTYKVGTVPPMFFVALDTTTSGVPARFCEWGFCDMVMDSGVTAAGGPIISRLQATALMPFGQVLEYSLPLINDQTVKFMYIGHACDSAGTAAAPAYARKVYTYPIGGWAPHGGV